MVKNRRKETNRPCAIYVRVSTKMQADDGLSLESQIDILRKEAERRGKPIFDIYNDAASGGSQAGRPEFMRLIKDSSKKPPPFDLILTWSISRFGRNDFESYVATEKLREKGITIFYYKEPFDDENPMGKLVIQILRAVAEFSRLEYAKDVERSKTYLANKGYSTGGLPPFGLRRVEVSDNGSTRIKWEPDPETAPVAKRIFEMYAKGKGFKTICKWLNDNGHKTTRGNPWKAASFSRMLRNEIYIGNIVYNKEVKRAVTRNGGSFNMKPEEEWIRHDGAFEPIVPVEIFDMVQARLAKQGRQHGQHHASPYLLSGFIKCGVCGCAYSGRTPKIKANGKTYSYSQYICSKQNRYAEKRDNVNIKREWFEDMVIERLFRKILSEKNIHERMDNETAEHYQTIEDKQKEIREMEREKKKLEEILGKYYKAFEEGDLDPAMLKKQVDKHQTRLEQIELDVRALRNWLTAFRANAEYKMDSLLEVDMEKLRAMFDSLPIESKKEFLKTFIQKIVVFPDRYRIHYTLPSGIELDRLEEVLGNTGNTKKGVVKSGENYVSEYASNAPNNNMQKKTAESSNQKQSKTQANKGTLIDTPSSEHFFVNESDGDSHLHKEVYKESWSPISYCKRYVIEPRY